MSVPRQLLIMAAVAVLAATAGYFLARSIAPATPDPGAVLAPANSPGNSPGSPEDLLGQPRPGFSLQGMDGGTISADDFDGQVLLINFWATWCKPCVEEMPMLSALAQSHRPMGLAIVGIAIDDAEKARSFVEGMALAYPVAVGSMKNAVTGREYGNRSGMLPYSVLVDRDGVVRWTHLGALERDVLVQQLEQLL